MPQTTEAASTHISIVDERQIDSEEVEFLARVRAWNAWLAVHRSELEAWVPEVPAEAEVDGTTWLALDRDGVLGIGTSRRAAAWDSAQMWLEILRTPEAAAKNLDAPSPGDPLAKYVANPIGFVELRGDAALVSRLATRLRYTG